MSLARPFPLALAALALALASCDARKVESASAASNRCARCHGGQEDQSGAPPLDTHGRSDPALPSVGAHAAHIRAGLDCSGCHVKPAPGDTSHIDGNVRVSFGPLATRNGALSPAYERATYGCSAVYCHGSFTGGNSTNAPRWTATGQHQADCGSCHGDVAGTAAPTSGHPALAAGSTNATCAACHPETVDSSGMIRATGKHVNGVFETDPAAKHPAGWTDPANDAFHGVAAALAPLTCNRCHAIRRPAAVTDVTCADCHLGGQAWTTTCNGCHGEPGDPRGAPPADVRGRTATTAIGVGAHRLHVDSQVVSGPLDCVFCHRKPADAYDPGHLDGTPTVTAYQGADAAWIAAGRDPGWNRGTASCSTSYCHSAYAPTNVPVWTAPRGNTCGTCHGLPPSAPHPDVGNNLTGCNACHPDTITAAGQLIPPPSGKHLDGRVSVSGGHLSGWIDPASPEFHAYSADRGLSACQLCHGANLAGGFTGVGCASCHDRNLPAGVASWKVNCLMCHGGTSDATGAPPRTIWGYQADPVRAGAHTAHVNGGPLAGPIACATCHVTPADALAAGHVDLVTGPTQPTASVAFSGLATANGAAPSWNRANRGCAVYCHGSSFVGTASQGSRPTPDWTGGPGEATCGSCHGVPPGGSHPQRTDCGGCHAGYGPATVNLATHLNGTVESPALGCSSCHGDAGRAATPLNPQLAAAPPYGTRGETATTDRAVGAHQLHLATGTLTRGIACTECHVAVTSTAAGNGHRNGTVELAWGPLASTGLAPGVIQWNGATCSSSYCHGNFHLGNALNAPVWTAPVANSCGTCHGIPPGGTHPTSAQCGNCHTGYTSTAVNRDTHVNGQLEVRTDCDTCHGDTTRLPVAPACGAGPICTDPLVKAAPPGTLTGRPAGAHVAHVNPATIRTIPLRCAECHLGAVPPSSPTHMDGTADVRFGARAAQGGNAPSYASATGCAATYCHGNYSGEFVYSYWDWGAEDLATTSVAYQGARATPRWTDGPTTCASCHGAPPQNGYWHSPTHGSQPAHRECQLCHPDASSVGGVPGAITNAALHVNGTLDVTPQWGSVCMDCH